MNVPIDQVVAARFSLERDEGSKEASTDSQINVKPGER